MGKICFHCNKPIEDSDKVQMVGLDVPYLNLFFHKACMDLSKTDINSYLAQNVEKVYNYMKNEEEKGKNRKK